MLLAYFKSTNKTVVGLIKGNYLVDLSHCNSSLIDIKSVLEFTQANYELLLDFFDNSQDLLKIELADLNYLVPLVPNSRIIAVGLNYLELNKSNIPEFPTFFTRFNSSFVTHYDSITLSKYSNSFDYEGELAVVINKVAKEIDIDEAHQYIGGYTLANDITARDYQAKSSQWLLGKNFDKCGSIGPAILLKKPNQTIKDFTITTKLNQQIVQSASTKQLIFSIPKLLVEITKVMTLQVGDIILTGTPPGVGHTKQPPRYLLAGDCCCIEIKEIGQLINQII